ncbi:hypothetical protein ACOZ4I_06490 [Haloarcula salina]|uniref:hypothetical protein n=1 Tax=Haloarcula salina TaxID=1429914 RepID=UPI003C7022D0
MPLFGSTNPGADAFHECPECGKDEIYSQSNGILSGSEYLCNHCGYEAEKSEVKKSFDELYSDNKRKHDKKVNEGLDKLGLDEAKIPKSEKEKLAEISDPELRQQVVDRQAEGWEIEEVTDSGERVVMVATEGGTIGGHALTGVLTGGWTFGLGNVAYSKLSKKKNKQRMVLRTEEESTTQEDDVRNPIEIIRELEELNKEGVITDAEFEEKKQELLDEV